MRLITFTADDRRALAQDRYHHPDPRIQRKMEVLWLKSHGLPHDRIAASADVSRRSVQRYLDQYLEDGLEGLRRGPWPHPESALAEHETSLEEYFREHPPRSAKQARAVIEQRTGLRRGLTQVRYFLKDRLGLRWRKTGAIPVPPKKTIQEHAREQATFVREELEPRLKQARRGRRQVYFVDAAHFEDEARFGTQGTITRVWAPKGSRPRAVRPNGREWLYVLMAVCVSTGSASALIMPELNTVVLNLFLEQFARELPKGVHAVLIWDGAGYHTSGDLVVPENGSLIQLPAYSPELNPVENLWHYLRAHHWSNREYEGYSGLEREAVRRLRVVCDDAENLKSICNADYVQRRA
jgi:transposase